MALPLRKPDDIKVYILYLMDKIGYPLDYPTLGAIMVQENIMNIVEFSMCFYALVDAGHIRMIKIDKETGKVLEDDEVEVKKTTLIDDDDDVFPYGRPEDDAIDDAEKRSYDVLYEITDKGRTIAEALSDDISKSVRERGYRSALRHLSFQKRGAQISHSWERDGKGFLFKCSITDRDGVALDLTLRADSEYQRDRMERNFTERPEMIFRGISALLCGDVNYIFEE